MKSNPPTMPAPVSRALPALLGLFIAATPSLTAQVTFTQVTNDADSGIDSSKTYTHAIDFGNGTPPTVNGVPFVQDFGTAAGGIPNTGSRTYGSSSHAGNTPPAVSGSVADIFRDMRYNGSSGQYVELTGLTPGQSYTLTIYDRAWDYQGTYRPVSWDFDVDSDSTINGTSPLYDTNDASAAPVSLGGNVSWMTRFTYTAGSNGTLRAILGDIGAATYHIYGLSNEEAGPDTTAPEIDTLDPADDSIGGYPGADLVATFNEDIALTGAGSITITDLDDASDNRTINLPNAGVSVAGDTLVIDLSALDGGVSAANLEFNTNYEINIGGLAIEDLADTPNAFAGTSVGDWNFTTVVADGTAPVINTIDPADDATGVAPTAILTATFDENIVAAAGDISIVDVTGAGADTRTFDVTDPQVSIVGNILTITPASLLVSPNEYAVQIAGTAIEDYSGNSFAGIGDTTTWSFNTTSSTTFITNTNQVGNDTWNQGGNWDIGPPPTGVLTATIGSGLTAVSEEVPDTYSGGLTFETDSELDIRDGADLNALGSGPITMNAGSTLRLRHGSTVTIANDIEFAGNVDITNSDNSTDNEVRLLTGTLSGAGQLTYSMRRGNVLHIAGNNSSWSGGFVANFGDNNFGNASRVRPTSDAAFGSGDVTLNDGISLEILSADGTTDTIDDSAALILEGRGRDNQKLKLGSNETVGTLSVNGFTVYAGTYDSGSNLLDELGNPLINGSGELTVLGPVDGTGPVVTGFSGPTTPDPIFGLGNIKLTVSFDEDVTDVDVGDFANAGTATVSVLSVNKLSIGFPFPASFDVLLSVDSGGTVQLQVPGAATITDAAGNNLSAGASDPTVYTFDTTPQPTRTTPTATTLATANNSNGDPVTEVVDVTGYDKIVACVTGEHGFNNTNGNCFSVTYNGSSGTGNFIQAVDRNPITNGTDILYNDIWYLDDPELFGTTGTFTADVSTRGNLTIIGLTQTEDGFAATAIGPSDSKDVDIFTEFANSIVIACHGVGGNGNTGATSGIDTVAPLVELSAQTEGSNWDGHVTGYATSPNIGTATYSFVGGSTGGAHSIAAEFPGAIVGSPTSPYDTWAAGPFTNPFNDTLTTDNPDGDSLSNLLEFAFGTDPTVSDASALVWSDPGFTPGTPTVQHAFPGSGVDFTARFIRRVDHGTSGSADYALRFSSDLTDWESSADGPGWFDANDLTVLETDGDYQLVEFPYPFFLDAGPKARFFQVEVTAVPSP